MQVGYAEIAILSQYLALLRAVKRSSGKCNAKYSEYSLLVVGNNDEVYDKKPHSYVEDNVTQW